MDPVWSSTELWKQAFWRLISALHISTGINFALVAANIGLVVVSISAMRKYITARQFAAATLVALLILGTGITQHHRTDSCLKKWYFEWWYAPLDSLLPWADTMAEVLIVAANVAVAFLVVAIATFHRESPRQAMGDIYLLADQLAKLRELLYAAAMVFTINVFAIYAGLYVNVAALPGDQKPLIQLVRNLTLVYGITYTILLLTAFYPCLLKLRTRAQLLAREHGGTSGPKQFLSTHGLEVNPFSDIKELIVVFAPLAASMAAAVIKP